MGKLKIDYGKLNAERVKHGVEKRNRVQEDNIGFFDMMNGKHIEAHLTTGEQIDGILETNAYNKYDVMLRNDEAVFVVRKDVVRYIKLYLNREEGEKKK